MRRALLVLLALVLLAGCGSRPADTGAVKGIVSSDDDGYAGVYLGDQPYAVPDVPLIGADGLPFDLATQTKRTLVFFGYTNCPDICSTVMSTLASAVAKLSPADRDKVQVVFVTTDPARDNAMVIRKYLDRFDPSFLGATGSLAGIEELGEPMKIYVKKGQKLPSGGYEVDHSTTVLSVLHAKADLLWTGATSPAEVSGDLTKILKADS